VFLLGAGVSSAFKLPNTPALLKELDSAAAGWGEVGADLKSRLTQAYEFLYPDAIYHHYQPDVVDFFSALSAFVGMGTGWPGTSLKDGPELLRRLKRGIAHLLITKERAIDTNALRRHSYLSRVVRPGNIVITTNWDTLVERFAELNDIPLRRAASSGKFRDTEVVLLKLHGSIDWCAPGAASRPWTDVDYAALREQQYGGTQYTIPITTESEPDQLVRIRSSWSALWQTVSSRAREPWLVTMVTGKQDELGPLQSVWRDAYAALGRAHVLEIAGYSLPADDVEVRTLLRAGMQRGNRSAQVRIVNPSPDVHARFRTLLTHDIDSEYVGVPPL